MKLINRVNRWVTAFAFLAAMAVSCILMALGLTNEGTVYFQFTLILLVASTALVTLIGFTIFARTFKIASFGTVNGKTVDLNAVKEKKFTPPKFDNNTSVPAELYLGFLEYNSKVFWKQKGETLTTATDLTLASAERKPFRWTIFPSSHYYAENPQFEANHGQEQKNTLFPYQITLLEGVLKGNPPAPTKNVFSFYQALFDNEVKKHVVTKTFKPTKMVAWWIGLATISLLPAFLLGAFQTILAIPLWLLVVSFSLGIFAVLSLGEEKYSVLDEEATRVVREGLAFNQYFKTASKYSQYGLEGQDRTGELLPWGVVFGMPEHWEKVFAYRTADGYMIHDTHFTKLTSQSLRDLMNKPKMSDVITSVARNLDSTREFLKTRSS